MTCSGALLSWDNEGRLTAWQNIENVTTSPSSIPALEEALYDGAGQRVQQVAESNATTTTTQHTYVGGSGGGSEDVASQWPNAGGTTTTTTTAYYGGGLAESVNGTLSYLLGDSLGSVSEAVNTSGTVTATQLYGLYGAVRYQSGTLPTDYGFTHQRADATSGLDYYGARYYDPVAGQFTSADTLLPKSVAQPDPHQLNRYAYVGGNPETKTDPTGHYLMPPKADGGPSWVTPHNDKWQNTYNDLKASNWPGQRFEDFDHDPRTGEKEAGVDLFHYFGYTDATTGIQEGPSVYKMDANVGKKLYDTTADFIIGYERPGLEIDIPGVDIPGVGMHTLQAATPIDLYTPKSPDLSRAMSEIVSKGKKAAIVAIDITNYGPLSGHTDTQIAFAQRITNYQGNAQRGTSVMRVIYIDNGQVVYDSNPLYGPPPAAGATADARS